MATIDAKIINGLVTFNASIMGVEGLILLDTISKQSSLNNAYFTNNEAKEIVVNLENQFDQILTVNKFNLANLTKLSQRLNVLGNKEKLIAILGIDFFKKHIITINYVDSKLSVDNIKELVNPLLMFSDNDLMMINVNFFNEIVPFVIDLVSLECITNSINQDKFSNEVFSEMLKLFYAKKFMIGDKVYDNILFRSTDEINNNVLGFSCFEKSIITIDYRNNQLSIERIEKEA